MTCRFDPSRFILEHYIDGDLVNSETPITREVATPDRLYVWGKWYRFLTWNNVAKLPKARICRLGFWSEQPMLA